MNSEFLDREAPRGTPSDVIFMLIVFLASARSIDGSHDRFLRN